MLTRQPQVVAAHTVELIRLHNDMGQWKCLLCQVCRLPGVIRSSQIEDSMLENECSSQEPVIQGAENLQRRP